MGGEARVKRPLTFLTGHKSSHGVKTPFLESPGNKPGPLTVFGDKCFLTEVNFC